ncbi:alpha-hydroxy acid oxidase [Pusillimonas noertemannii]|uniref:4-hydroxymandelate oxidase n=1 Tax=Pusillimonas noertemannii TaxID=305977 RepID=A0A2U1CJ83_9BURK|nr:alpha-hydroxy acid oxidase [Pusillimonas noertemannii]NYT70098.1 alpha-hydroxy-acid oxidizing protein [Pusillimonas noertemannii]PVY61044.1 4-hydroxymandelate oxidase [Pusillimonas noertemannii]TFL08304.1 alpha-hydroxy-acid oxidizing protein [Pusillimonas noertemannii]
MNKPLPPLAQIPPQIAAVADYEPYARQRMTEAAWAYLDGASGDELTCAENRAAFGRIRLRQRVLADMRQAHTRVELLGHVWQHPIMLAPVAFQKLAHPQGEQASCLAACAMGAGMVVGTQASVSLEALAGVAASANAPLWFQLYIQPDRDFTLALVRRAEQAGYKALVLTVDAPVNGVRNREQRTGFALPAGIQAVNLQGMKPVAAHTAQAGASPLFGDGLLNEAPRWTDLRWLVDSTSLPVVVKGIMDPDDARLALEHGAAGIIVSNHGGRTLDGLPATIEVLPEVANAVGDRVPVLLDGGIRRGTDVFKALALGARAVLVGRPYVHGLAAAGAAGVVHVLHMLRTELEIAMALAGTPTLADIDRSALWQS